MKYENNRQWLSESVGQVGIFLNKAGQGPVKAFKNNFNNPIYSSDRCRKIPFLVPLLEAPPTGGSAQKELQQRNANFSPLTQ